MPERSQALLHAVEAHDIVHRYSGVLALDGVSISVIQGSFCALLGPNGAGKSTLAQILSGMLRPTSGTVCYAGAAPGSGLPETGLARSGVCLVPEGRRLFGQLSIEDNLVLGGYGAGLRGIKIRQRMDEVMEFLPPRLREGMKTRLAGMLSGGERQMLALARALMASPKLLLIDEPSMGLAPLLIEKVYDVLQELNSRGVTIVVVEQKATHAVRFAKVIYLLERGKISYSGEATGEAAQAALRAGYVGEAVS